MVVPPTSPNRAALRAQMRETRARFVATLAPSARAALDAALVARLRPLLGGSTRIAGYAAMADEIDPAGVGFDIWPRVGARDEPLTFHRAAPGDLLPGCWGVREPPVSAPPARPRAILVPLVAADACGNRLGYGAGNYDRTLPLHDTPRIGVAFDCQVVDRVTAEAWDAPLDWLVTPTRTIRCTAEPPA